jgi:hypothetical protein
MKVTEAIKRAIKRYGKSIKPVPYAALMDLRASSKEEVCQACAIGYAVIGHDGLNAALGLLNQANTDRVYARFRELFPGVSDGKVTMINDSIMACPTGDFNQVVASLEDRGL